MSFGFTEKQFNIILGIISKYSEIEEAIIFGSRADGTNKEASDVDIAIKCSALGFHIRARLLTDFEESSLPFFFDVVDFNGNRNEKLKGHIDNFGKVFYKKGTTILNAEF
ncbi:MAG: nucleotidyltransferase domain-containing protein [FCB group bacterium]|jgi:predicted nucleotidyltransferase